MRCGVFLLATLLSLGFDTLVYLLPSTPESMDNGRTILYILICLIALAVLVVIILGVVLILNGFTMIRKEGRRLANLLGLFLGLVMIGYVVLSIVAILTDNTQVFYWLFMLGIPMAYLGFGFTAYLLYSALYLAVTKRWAKPPAIVVILGSGLIKNKVPPLLASRLDKGMAIAKKAKQEPVFIVSGGMGSDEARSEASAMAEYLEGKGIEPDKILQEDLSRSTRENIVYTKALLDAEGITGPIAAVTNNFHAFRAALLLNREKLPGYAIGSPTARYYWPAATIREYVAIMYDSRIFSLVCLILSFVPVLALSVSTLIRWIF